ncbi:pirin family protein [Oxalobacteraceae bacterium OM1]|nr:pirin family protein [Oxalobacteraceae bacterium OM1]
MTRTLLRIIEGMATSDGAGVRLRRSIGRGPDARLDPFLMLDEFSSENPDDYISGFPAHPHRGFETVTYMLDGHMRHEDHMGNVGELRSGGVQWMTAGRGVIHSEMPQQESGRMRGFQLWINLPAKEKMKPAGYRDIQADQIPVAELSNGARVKVIAGAVESGGTRVAGPIQGLSTDPLYLDVVLAPGSEFTQPVKADYHAFLYVYEGSVQVGDGEGRTLKSQHAGILSPGDTIRIAAGTEEARFILLAGRPLREPIVQYGPFVMNKVEEIEQAIVDYQQGKFAEPA